MRSWWRIRDRRPPGQRKLRSGLSIPYDDRQLGKLVPKAWNSATWAMVPRSEPDALLTDPQEAAHQVRRLVTQCGVQSICVHGDSPDAVEFARSQGAPAIEGYPVDNRGEKVDLTMAYVGTRSLFERAGFVKAADTDSVLNGFPRVLMRLDLADGQRPPAKLAGSSSAIASAIFRTWV